MLYVKTANTFAAHGATIAVPGEVDVGAALGLVKSDLQCFQTLAQAGQALFKHGIRVGAHLATIELCQIPTSRGTSKIDGVLLLLSQPLWQTAQCPCWLPPDL